MVKAIGVHSWVDDLLPLPAPRPSCRGQRRRRGPVIQVRGLHVLYDRSASRPYTDSQRRWVHLIAIVDYPNGSLRSTPDILSEVEADWKRQRKMRMKPLHSLTPPFDQPTTCILDLSLESITCLSDRSSPFSLAMIVFVATISLVLYALYSYIIHPLFFSPLRSIPPAHWSTIFSNLWIQYHRARSVETFVVHDAHQRLGPLLRLGPDCISVNNVDGGIRTVYTGGWEKGDWYANVFCNYGTPPMFAMSSHQAHAQRKRMVSNVYAKTTLQTSAALAAITKTVLDGHLVAALDGVAASDDQTMDFYDTFCAATMDVVSAYVFGRKNGSDFLQQPKLGQKFFRDYKARQDYQFWPQDAVKTTAFLAVLRLQWLVVPAWVSTANQDIEAWIMAMCDKAEKSCVQILGFSKNQPSNDEDYPAVYMQLRSAMSKGVSNKDDNTTARLRTEIASETLDHVLAGFDTSSITLTFLAWELSLPQHKLWQRQVHAELAALPDKSDAKAVDNLPVLHAVLMESLRLHAAIPGNQPRITPLCASLGHVDGLPAGIRVQAQAWSLHRNPDVFPDPDTWRPERWLDASDEHKKEMARWFWAFGSGGRMYVSLPSRAPSPFPPLQSISE